MYDNLNIILIPLTFSDWISKTPETISDAAVHSLSGIKNYKYLKIAITHVFMMRFFLLVI